MAGGLDLQDIPWPLRQSSAGFWLRPWIVALPPKLVSYHVSLLIGDDLLQIFWEVEEVSPVNPVLSAEEMAVVRHFETHHSRNVKWKICCLSSEKIRYQGVRRVEITGS